MDAADVCVVSSRDGGGGLVVRIGIPLADVYLELLGGRCRPNTVLAAAYDLKVFFAVVASPPDQVRPADVLAFITAQRTGRAGEHGVLQPLKAGDEPGGVSAATVRRRLSIVDVAAGAGPGLFIGSALNLVFGVPSASTAGASG